MKIKEYWIDKVKNIKEYAILAQICDGELLFVGKETQRLYKDQYIEISTLSGIERREKLLKLKKYADDSLESRRFRVRTRWNNQLPYTYRNLINKLDNILGESNYDIYLYPNEYTLDIRIRLYDLRMLQETYDMLRAMVPANIFIEFAEHLVEFFVVDIRYETSFSMETDFYTRGDLEPLFLDGASLMDGMYFISGHKTELYPLSMMVGMDMQNNVDYTSNITIDRTWYLDGTYILDGNKKLDADIYKEVL